MYPAEDIAQYLIHLANLEEDDPITNLKLQKLLYYVQGFHLALFDSPLFSENIVAWQYGPVVPEVYRKYKQYSRNPLESSENFNPESIDGDVRDLIDEVYGVYGKYTGTVLANFTHQEAPWKNTEINDIISHQLMQEYFKSQINQN